MVKKGLKVAYWITLIVLTSCNVQESVAFKFKRKDGKLTSHPENLQFGNLQLSLNSIIGGNQKYQGLNNELNLKSLSSKTITIDSIITFTELYKGSSIRNEICESFSGTVLQKFPLLIEPNESKYWSIITPNQEAYEFNFGDSINVKIEVFLNSQKEKSISFTKTKYYDKSKYLVTL